MPNQKEEKTPNVESEIEELRAQLAEKEKMLEKQKPAPEIPKPEQKPEPEKIAEVKKQVETETAPEEKAPKALSERMSDPDILKDLKDLMESGASKPVIELAYLAFERNVNYALDIAEQTQDPSILAEFRGILVGELYEKLKEKNKI